MSFKQTIESTHTMINSFKNFYGGNGEYILSVYYKYQSKIYHSMINILLLDKCLINIT